METGRWVTHLGFERGNAIVEAQQRYVGRPWSGWSRMVVQQLPQMSAPSINYIDSTHEWVSGRGEPGATVKVHVHGVVIRDVGVDRSRKLGNTYRKTTGWKKDRSTTIQGRKTMVRLGRTKCGR